MSASTEKKNRQAARQAGTDKKIIAIQQEEKKKQLSKRRWTWGTIGVVVLIVAILLLDSGLMYKTVAYTAGDKSYTAAEANYYYATQYYNFANQYGSYASLFGLDTSTGLQGLDKQQSPMSDGSWKDYFLDAAKDSMLQAKVLSDFAKENGTELTQEELDNIEATFTDLDSAARLQGYANGDKLIAANYGQGVNVAMMRNIMTVGTLGSKAAQEKYDSFTYDESALSEHYKSFDGSKDYFDYAYYLVAGETTETTDNEGAVSTTVSEEALAAAKKRADEIMTAYSKDKNEDYVARLEAAAGESVNNMESSAGNSISVAYDWLKDSARKTGDVCVELNSAETGYNVVVFIGRDNNNYKTASVRHILVKAEAAEDGTFTDEAKAAAKARAEEILAEYKAGDKTESSFADLAEKYSEDEGSNTNGGLYENIAKGQMVEQFDAFCFDSHKAGDTDVVYGESGSYAGYHVMYYVGEGQLYSNYIAEQDLREHDYDAWLQDQLSKYETSEGFGMKFVG